MAEIVNLRRWRKRRAKEDAAALAAANRSRHGQTLLERAAPAQEAAERNRLLDGARLPSPGDGEPGE